MAITRAQRRNRNIPLEKGIPQSRRRNSFSTNNPKSSQKKSESKPTEIFNIGVRAFAFNCASKYIKVDIPPDGEKTNIQFISDKNAVTVQICTGNHPSENDGRGDSKYDYRKGKSTPQNISDDKKRRKNKKCDTSPGKQESYKPFSYQHDSVNEESTTKYTKFHHRSSSIDIIERKKVIKIVNEKFRLGWH